jgi:AcrR family transcriptional regulator
VEAQIGKPKTGRGSKPRVNVAERREAYIRIAARVFLEKGLGGATMLDIADAAGVPKVLFYRIFSSKKNLLDAIRDHVLERIHESYTKPFFVYGARAMDMARSARACPEPFLLVLRYSQAAVEQLDWAEAVTSTIAHYTRERWFAIGPDAPPGAAERADYASRLNVGPFIETVIAWIEERDGLNDDERLKWWGRIQREFHLSSRDAFRLGTAPQLYSLADDA